MLSELIHRSKGSDRTDRSASMNASQARSSAQLDIGAPVGSIRDELSAMLQEGRPTPGTTTCLRFAAALERVISGEEEFRPVYEAFPRLMLKFFGFGEDGWLEEACGVESKERDAILSLLLPNGPLHKLACATAPEYTFDFPLSNLPPRTQAQVNDIVVQSHTEATSQRGGLIDGARGASGTPMPLGTSSGKDNHGSLSYFFARRLLGTNQQLTVSCYEYFLLCLLSSPLWRSRSRMAGMEPRKRKRSSLLPSRRAVFNQLFYEYLKFFVPVDGRDGRPAAAYGELFVRASIEFYLTSSGASKDVPTAGTMDAIALMALHVQPRRAREGADVFGTRDEMFAVLDNARLTDAQCTSSISSSQARKMIIHELRLFASGAESVWAANSSLGSSSLLSLVRAVSLHTVPWSWRMRETTEQRLLPRKRRRQGVAASALERLPPALGERINDINDSLHHAGVAEQRTVVSDREFLEWTDYVKFLDLEITYILPRFVEKAAKLNLGAVEDGARLLMSLSEAFAPQACMDALSTARASFRGPWFTIDAESNLRELATQISTYRRQGGLSPGFPSWREGPGANLYGLAAALGILIQEPGAFGIPSLKPGRRNRTGTASSASEKMRQVLQPDVGVPEVMRRQVALGQRKFSNRDVEFLGGAWDLPPFSYEFAPLLPVLYNISMELSRQLQIEVNLRPLASYQAIVGIPFTLSVLYALITSSLH